MSQGLCSSFKKKQSNLLWSLSAALFPPVELREETAAGKKKKKPGAAADRGRVETTQVVLPFRDMLKKHVYNMLRLLYFDVNDIHYTNQTVVVRCCYSSIELQLCGGPFHHLVNIIIEL